MKKFLKIICCLVIGISFCILPSNTYANEAIDKNETVGRSVTYEEILNKISEIQKCSLKEAEDFLINSQLKRENVSLHSINQTAYQRAQNNVRSLSYWEDRTYVTSYNHNFPSRLYVYYSYTGTSSKRHIQEIIIVNVECHNGSIKKVFEGTVSVNLQGDQRYHYYVYGDLYNHGTETSGITVNIGIDEFLNIEFENNTASNYYDYINRSGYCYGYR